MKHILLFFSLLFSVIACTTKNTEEKEILFYARILQEKKAEVHTDIVRMQKWINDRGIGRDLPFLIDSKNILDTIDVLVEKNQLATAEKIIEKKLKQLSGLALIDPAAAILEMQYMDSLFAVKHDTIANILLRASIYNGLQLVVENNVQNFGTYCGFAAGTKAIYESEAYKLYDTLRIVVMPDNPRCTGNIADVMCQQKEEMEFEYIKYYFIQLKTADTLKATYKSIKQVLLVSTVLKEKGDYVLQGTCVVSGKIGNRSGSFALHTNELIRIK